MKILEKSWVFLKLLILLLIILLIVFVVDLRIKKFTDNFIHSVVILEKFEQETNQKFLDYVSATWLSDNRNILVSVCADTSYITIERLYPRQGVTRYKIIDIEEINSMFGFVKFKVQDPIFQDFLYIQINKLFQINATITISYTSLIDKCDNELCTKVFHLRNRLPLKIFTNE